MDSKAYMYSNNNHVYDDITAVEDTPPPYEGPSASVTTVRTSSNPNPRRVIWYAVGLSLGVAVVAGVVTGLTIGLIGESIA